MTRMIIDWLIVQNENDYPTQHTDVFDVMTLKGLTTEELKELERIWMAEKDRRDSENN